MWISPRVQTLLPLSTQGLAAYLPAFWFAWWVSPLRSLPHRGPGVDANRGKSQLLSRSGEGGAEELSQAE